MLINVIKLKLLLSLFVIKACDLNIPEKNNLLDYRLPITVFHTNNSRPSIFELPDQNDVTNILPWEFKDYQFQIRLESVIENVYTLSSDQLVYEGYHKTYIVFLDNKDYVELGGFSSLKINLSIFTENHLPHETGEYLGNPYYDDINTLKAQEASLFYLSKGETDYIEVTNIDQLKDLSVPVNLRLYLKISSGINLRTRTRHSLSDGSSKDLTDFVPNNVVIKINMTLKGLYE